MTTEVAETTEPVDTTAVAPPSPRGVRRYLPALMWLADYETRNVPADLTAGLFVAMLLVPQAMAYALLAGLSPEVGLHAAVVAPLLYALLGTSRFLAVGPVALVSLIVAEGAADVAATTSLSAAEAALVLAALAGLTLVVMGLLRLGFVVNFISSPVLTGFAGAAALLIGASQLRHLLGVQVARADGFFGTLVAVGSQLDEANGTALTLGLIALAAILSCGRPVERRLLAAGVRKPVRILVVKGMPLYVVLSGTLATWALGLEVETVGRLGASLPSLTMPVLDAQVWMALLPTAVAAAGVAFLTSMAISISLGARRRQQIEPSQELVALGMANLGAALTGGYPVGGSLSRSAVSFDTGAVTPLAGAFAALAVAAAALLIGPLLRFLPTAVLAAVIISAVIGLIDVQAALRTWRYSRADGLSLAATFLTALAFGVEVGILVGMASGLVIYLWRTSQPRVVVEGRLESGPHFRSEERADVEPVRSPILVLRVDQDLYFANTKYVRERALKEVAERKELCCLVLDFKAVNEVDTSAAEMLEDLVDELREAGVQVSVASLKGPVEARLERVGMLDHIGRERVFLNADEAVATLEDRLGVDAS